nr:hypothetical protein CFP56_37088 [Quercus suber]
MSMKIWTERKPPMRLDDALGPGSRGSDLQVFTEVDEHLGIGASIGTVPYMVPPDRLRTPRIIGGEVPGCTSRSCSRRDAQSAFTEMYHVMICRVPRAVVLSMIQGVPPWHRAITLHVLVTAQSMLAIITSKTITIIDLAGTKEGVQPEQYLRSTAPTIICPSSQAVRHPASPLPADTTPGCLPCGAFPLQATS